ncbi:FAD/NAD(P)-binding protein [Candidatus Sumerlaeota bacterium]|nr:FAD/NAD(P)-binding protein [Candidatus Sumerlaeota bacterium]
MLYVFGVGEAAISIASSSANPELLSHTIRMVGQVTNALGRDAVGGAIGLRGPFGSHWPIANARGKNLILVAGGIGLPPLRPVIDRVIRHRAEFGRVALVYGAKTVSDLLYTHEYDLWRRNGIEMIVTVDRADEKWTGERGLVPAALKKLRLRGADHVAFMCGPEIMMKYAVQECLNREIAEDRIFVSLERNMKCACTFCGHCQLGPEFVCRDGPIFSYQRIKRWFCREGF